MEKKNKIMALRLCFLGIFSLAVLIGKSINFSAVIGAENQFFTIYQLIGPIAGSFLGTTFGVIAVLGAELAHFLISQKPFTLINLLRITPMLFAAYYFGNKNRLKSAIIPALCMAFFIAHPVGRQAWPFSLYWLIPIFGRIMPNKTRFRDILQSFGATFTSHAVGSVLWLYTIPMDSAQWLALIPIVAFERLVFGTGIFLSYHFTKFFLKKLAKKISIMSSVANLNAQSESEKEAVAVEA